MTSHLATPDLSANLTYVYELPEQVDDWAALGLCRQVDPEAFFPEKGASARPAKKICRRCDVREKCLNAALSAGEMHGVWGGTTPQERAAILMGRPLPTALPLTVAEALPDDLEPSAADLADPVLDALSEASADDELTLDLDFTAALNETSPRPRLLLLKPAG
ncbi:WhiB family transcriptional regulator [Gordonia alkaliphila]|uniref:WhiB family transcriptional regulator n=1 Tax=Gordonia alkaliphila TaxID=1053547 RepID=UPI003557E2FA